jgi:diamine N-acetyltransferase
VDTNSGGIEQPLLNMVGDKVALGPTRRELLPLLLRWQNDFFVLRTIHPIRPLTMETLDAAYMRGTTSMNEVHFVVYERETLRPIGAANLTNIVDRTAELGIMLGERDTWRKGYGTEVARLVLDYGFNALGLHNILGIAYSFNQPSINMCIRAGFRVIGRRREVMSRGGKLHDHVYMECLATEFESPGLRQLLLESESKDNR